MLWPINMSGMGGFKPNNPGEMMRTTPDVTGGPNAWMRNQRYTGNLPLPGGSNYDPNSSYGEGPGGLGGNNDSPQFRRILDNLRNQAQNAPGGGFGGGMNLPQMPNILPFSGVPKGPMPNQNRTLDLTGQSHQRGAGPVSRLRHQQRQQRQQNQGQQNQMPGMGGLFPNL